MLLFNGRNASGPERAHYIFTKRTRPTRRRTVMKCVENGPNCSCRIRRRHYRIEFLSLHPHRRDKKKHIETARS